MPDFKYAGGSGEGPEGSLVPIRKPRGCAQRKIKGGGGVKHKITREEGIVVHKQLLKNSAKSDSAKKGIRRKIFESVTNSLPNLFGRKKTGRPKGKIRQKGEGD